MKRKSDRQEGLPPAKQQNSIKGLRALQHAKLPDQAGFPRAKEQSLGAGINISNLLADLIISANQRPLSSAENQISGNTSIRPNDPNLEGMPIELIQLILDRLVDERISSGETRELFEDFESLSTVSSKIKAAVAGSPAARKAELHYYALHLYEDLSKFAETYKTHDEIYQESWGRGLDILDRRLASGEISEEHYDREADDLLPRMSQVSAIEEHEAWCEKFARKFRKLLPNVKYIDERKQNEVVGYFETMNFEPQSAPLVLDALQHADDFCASAKIELNYQAILVIGNGEDRDSIAFNHIAKAKFAGQLYLLHEQTIERIEKEGFAGLSNSLHRKGLELSKADDKHVVRSGRADILHRAHHSQSDRGIS